MLASVQIVLLCHLCKVFLHMEVCLLWTKRQLLWYVYGSLCNVATYVCSSYCVYATFTPKIKKIAVIWPLCIISFSKSVHVAETIWLTWKLVATYIHVCICTIFLQWTLSSFITLGYYCNTTHTVVHLFKIHTLLPRSSQLGKWGSR